jgi:alpha-1,2-mannosyltransferase
MLIKPPARPPNFLDGKHIQRYGLAFLLTELSLFLFVIAGTHGLIVPLDRATTTDFVSFYAAGSLADAGAPELAYDQAAHYAAEQRATARGVEYNFFYYPPPFLLVCGALAQLPYLPAFVAFQVLTLVAFLLVARLITQAGRWRDLSPLLAFPAVLWTIGLGQNAFLTAALLGAGTLLLDRRPIASGLVFGALCYKPHFALLVPVALAAGGHWRAFVAAGFSAATLAAASLAVFGWTTWSAYLTAFADSHSVYESGRVALGAFVTPFGGVRLLGGSPHLAYALQLAATTTAAALVAIVWRRQPPLPIRAAMLASATLVAVPLALVYDLMLAGVAGLWLLRAEGEYRLPEWGKWTLLGLFVLTLNPRGVAEHWGLPLGSLITLTLFALVALIALPLRPQWRGALTRTGTA